ncbi:MAG: hypothetical protein R3A48_19740 [Polyangiales bacterium]
MNPRAIDARGGPLLKLAALLALLAPLGCSSSTEPDTGCLAETPFRGYQVWGGDTDLTTASGDNTPYYQGADFYRARGYTLLGSASATQTFSTGAYARFVVVSYNTPTTRTGSHVCVDAIRYGDGSYLTTASLSGGMFGTRVGASIDWTCATCTGTPAIVGAPDGRVAWLYTDVGTYLPGGGCVDHLGNPSGFPNLRRRVMGGAEVSSDAGLFGAFFTSVTQGGSVTVVVADCD